MKINLIHNKAVMLSINRKKLEMTAILRGSNLKNDDGEEVADHVMYRNIERLFSLRKRINTWGHGNFI